MIPSRHSKLSAIGCIMLAIGILLSPASLAENDLEAKVKAAYLFHLTKFVDWPKLPADNLRICVVGNDPAGRLLGELSNRQVKELPLKIEVNSPVDLALCQVLFISRSERKWGELLEKLDGKSVLTVSDLDNFARHGGMVGFYSEGGKIKLEINPVAARNANLRISSKLMELARPVSSTQE
jgi:hypothetical protein